MNERIEVIIRLGIWILTAISFYLAGIGTNADDKIVTVLIVLGVIVSLFLIVCYKIFLPGKIQVD